MVIRKVPLEYTNQSLSKFPTDTYEIVGAMDRIIFKAERSGNKRKNSN